MLAKAHQKLYKRTAYIKPTHFLLTYSMEQSTSWEANQFAASQEIPRILLNLKVHYRIHNCPPPVPILSQLNPVHTPTTHYLKIHINIILPSMPGSPQWSLSLRFPHQNPLHTYPISATRDTHLILLDFINCTILGEKQRSLSSSLSSFSPLTFYLVPLRPKYSPQHPILKYPQPTFLSQCEWLSFTPIKNKKQNYTALYLNL
jgi:hypothetical protein